MNTNLVCVVCFGTNDRELVRFTTLRLNPKLDRELARTMVDSDSVIFYSSSTVSKTRRLMMSDLRALKKVLALHFACRYGLAIS